MPKQDEPLWTIAELGAQVALALSVDYQGAPNGRVRDVPDPRTIRYYTTLGLLDRPALMRGRTALYGRRHLWQLCAIKRLQARGLALAEIQQQLVGITPRKLQDLAQVPAELEPLYVTTAQQAETPTPERAGAFWKMAPAGLAAWQRVDLAAGGRAAASRRRHFRAARGRGAFAQAPGKAPAHRPAHDERGQPWTRRWRS
jgi:DNA-binding transcriptional MerR regulator